jgi:hypothetical protein
MAMPPSVRAKVTPLPRAMRLRPVKQLRQAKPLATLPETAIQPGQPAPLQRWPLALGLGLPRPVRVLARETLRAQAPVAL